MSALSNNTVPDHLSRERPYSRAEVISDGAVHLIALCAALVGCAWLLGWTASDRSALEKGAIGVYAAALITMLGCSFAYNMTPASPLKWLLRRFDLAGIFLLIAGTYTPLLTQVPDRTLALTLGALVWTGALAGIVMVTLFPGRGERYRVFLYLGLAWVAIIAAGPLMTAFSPTALVLIIAGGLFYTLGVIFFVWNSLRFQNVIWHSHVVTAAACHYAAISHVMSIGVAG